MELKGETDRSWDHPFSHPMVVFLIQKSELLEENRLELLRGATQTRIYPRGKSIVRFSPQGNRGCSALSPKRWVAGAYRSFGKWCPVEKPSGNSWLGILRLRCEPSSRRE